MSEFYDYVIAGAGSAGCVLAARLAEYDNKATICLIEAGRDWRSLWTRMPAANGFVFGNPRFDWGFKSVPQESLNGRRIYYPRGKGVGGTSLINGMVYMRGASGDYDRWSQMGLKGWSYAEVLPYFRRSEGASHWHGSAYHGTKGPLKLTPSGNYDRLSELFTEAAYQAGNPLNADLNGAAQRGVGRIDVKVWKGNRQSTSATYLNTVPENLKVLTGQHVMKVLFEGRRARGLQLEKSKVFATREVILCLGTFGSPQILMLSGIGSAAHLSDMGINVVHDSPGVGANLFDHPQMPVKFNLLSKQHSFSRYQRLDKAIGIGIRYILTQSGPGAAPFWSVVLFHSLIDLESPELEIYMTPMCTKEESASSKFRLENLFNIGNLIMARGKTAIPGVQIEINVNRPRSFGQVRLSSDIPFDQPRIDPRWFSDSKDMQEMLAGIEHVREIMSQGAFRGIVGNEYSPGTNVRSKKEMTEAVRNHVTTGHHPVSTCRMGCDGDPGAVLDHEFRVRGVDSLRVVDASAFPDQIGGNINAPVIMMAEKAADIISGHQPLPAEYPAETVQ